jgi:UDP-N-acetylmuramate dehydrogenase
MQNIGAYGQEVSQCIAHVEVFDRVSRKTQILKNADCGFAYRQSLFKSAWKNRYVITAVEFSLRLHGQPDLIYQDLARHFQNKKPTLPQVRDAVIAIRRKKSMLYDRRDPNHRSAGSFFTNPFITAEQVAHIGGVASQEPPTFPAADKFKVSAAWLIEHAGFQRGYSQGEVGLSTQHALAIINRGHATAAQLRAFAEKIQNAVYEKFGIVLQTEPEFVGFEVE